MPIEGVEMKISDLKIEMLKRSEYLKEQENKRMQSATAERIKLSPQDKDKNIFRKRNPEFWLPRRCLRLSPKKKAKRKSPE